MQKRYPDLGSSEPGPKACATTDFLHDFVVDFGPGFVDNVPPAEARRLRPHLPSTDTGGSIELTKVEEDKTLLPERSGGLRYEPLPLDEHEQTGLYSRRRTSTETP